MKTLAIFGGEKTVPDGYIKTWPPLTQDDRDAVLSVFDSNVLHGIAAPQCKAFQEEFAEFLGVKHCLVVNSGTAALHMAITSLGIGPGDEVILPAFTYWSSAAIVLHQNAIPVFVDIDKDTFSLNPDLLEAAITPRTKAILPVHIHGMPADLERIIPIAKKHGIPVVGDCCQAHGASINGKYVGSMETTAGFSCNRSKNLSGGEGGMFVTNSEDAYQFASWMRDFREVPIDAETTPHKLAALGWNYRPHEFVTALIRSQFKHLPENNARRREMAHYMTEKLANIPGLKGPFEPADRKPVYFSYIVDFRPQELGLDIPVPKFKAAMIKILRAEGIGFGQWQTRPVPSMEIFQHHDAYGKGCPWNCPHYKGFANYNPSQYPVTQEFIANHSYLSSLYPPNNLDLVDLYVQGFQKVVSQPEKILEVANSL
ncbi:MAG: DegT/DnrJ/EryC1/StrS family aminotransferase [Lentisphaeria bacterium]|nr:DegT/DnrJ/EryC1/StrS family aminotransferase [Lentisphaeria bacterium]